jgi:hypothetical protein
VGKKENRLSPAAPAEPHDQILLLWVGARQKHVVTRKPGSRKPPGERLGRAGSSGIAGGIDLDQLLEDLAGQLTVTRWRDNLVRLAGKGDGERG